MEDKIVLKESNIIPNNAISFFFQGEENIGGCEMLRIAEDGFYVRGVKVEQDENEAKKVHKAFKEWMISQRIIEE